MPRSDCTAETGAFYVFRNLDRPLVHSVPQSLALPQPKANRAAGLYVHVPFCVHKCCYCDFYSLALAPKDQAEASERYLDALALELAAAPASFRPRTIFVGGGTPTELSAAQLMRLLDLLHTHIDCSGVEEWTCEINPGTLTLEKATILRGAGVNRASLGVQSFNPSVLKFLGRIHNGEEAREGYDCLRQSGFTNINIDLISAVPGSPPERLRDDLTQAIELSPEHVAVYTLIFENETPLMALKKRGKVAPVDESTELQEYQLTAQIFASAGYERYEISNYCKQGTGDDFRCQHNLFYWGPGDYLGVGPAAHSCLGGRRFANVRSLTRYTRAWLGSATTPADPQLACAFSEQLAPEDAARELLVMWLRQTAGVCAAEFIAYTGYDYRILAGEHLASWSKLGLVSTANERLRLTRRGFEVADSLFVELV